MNNSDLLKTVISLLANESSDENPATKGKPANLTNHLINQYVIIRSRNEGVNAGLLIKADETGVVLKDARRLWYMEPADKSQSWYEGVANSGLSPKSKVSPEVSEKIIIEDYSITKCTEKAALSIIAAPNHEQS